MIGAAVEHPYALAVVVVGTLPAELMGPAGI
jgi:hypothetical protein